MVYHGGAYYGNSAWHGGYYNGGYHGGYGYNNAYNHNGNNYNNAYNKTNAQNKYNNYKGSGNTYNKNVSGNTVNVNKQSAQNFGASHPSASNSWAQHDSGCWKIERFQWHEWTLRWIWRFRRLVLEGREQSRLGEHALQRIQRWAIRRRWRIRGWGLPPVAVGVNVH